MSTERVAVLGATGPVGYQVIESLNRRGMGVVAVSRNAEKLARLSDQAGLRFDSVVADISDASGVLAELARNCSAFVLTAGVDPAQLDQQLGMVRSVVSAGPRRLVYVSSCWSYAPLVRDVVDENHPRTAGGRVRYRAAAEDLVIAAGGTVLHLPDFYGPRVHVSPLQRVLSLAVAGRRITWPAGADTVREHVYIEDVGEMVVGAIDRTPAGTHLIVPGSGPITFAEMLAHSRSAFGAPVRGSALGRLPLPLLRMFDPWSRHLGDALTEYRKPVRYDGSALRSFIGSVDLTPYERGIAATVEWMRSAGDR
jgi:nucleoside-diphosphate-sugar epimerase